MKNTMTRRSMLTRSVPAAVIATGAAAIGATATTRPPAEIPVQTIGHWDPVTEWYSAHQDVVCCTPAERDALLNDRPELSGWSWTNSGDRVVGMSPWRPAPHWTGDDTQDLRMAIARLREVKSQRQAQA
jgi:hypothetical protein